MTTAGYEQQEDIKAKFAKAQSEGRKQQRIERLSRFTKEEFKYLHLVFLKDPNQTSEIEKEIKAKEGVRLSIEESTYIKQKYQEWLKHIDHEEWEYENERTDI